MARVLQLGLLVVVSGKADLSFKLIIIVIMIKNAILPKWLSGMTSLLKGNKCRSKIN